LVIAGLAAEGETVVSDAEHIARGYDDIAGKLNGIGGKVAYR
jgi:UDP-N-acetylglucosamine 1-carboxyvinyltransferase